MTVQSYPVLSIMGVDGKMLPGSAMDVRYQEVFVLPGKRLMKMRWSGGGIVLNTWANGQVEIDAVAGRTYVIGYTKEGRTVRFTTQGSASEGRVKAFPSL